MRASTTPAGRAPPRTPPVAPAIAQARAAAFAPLAALREQAAHCRECPLGARATQTVFGEGPAGARLMLVGEQPDDREDLAGRPFVGPARRLLDQALAALGWDRRSVHVTNAVKHFKHELRGRRRMHKTPGQQEMLACAHWLRGEIDAVEPAALVALGGTAARSLPGREVKVLAERGRWAERPDGIPVLVTLHPSSLLRGDPGEREQAFARWVADRGVASKMLQAH